MRSFRSLAALIDPMAEPVRRPRVPALSAAARLAPRRSARPTSASMLRVDQAGEYGATRIYAGQLAVLGDGHPPARLIARMAAQEQRHLKPFRRDDGRARRPPDPAPAVLARRRPCARRGDRADQPQRRDGLHRRGRGPRSTRHYSEQLEALGDDDPPLAATIADFQAEELEHRDAAIAAGAEDAFGYPISLSRDPRRLPGRDRAVEEDLNHACHAARPDRSRRHRRARPAARRARAGGGARGAASSDEDVPVNQLLVYGDDPCPASTDDVIIVCARLPEQERFRIPPNLREQSQRSGQPGLGRPRDRAQLCRPHRHRQLLADRPRRRQPAASTRSSAGPRRAARRGRGQLERLIEQARQERLRRIDEAIMDEERAGQPPATPRPDPQ